MRPRTGKADVGLEFILAVWALWLKAGEIAVAVAGFRPSNGGVGERPVEGGSCDVAVLVAFSRGFRNIRAVAHVELDVVFDSCALGGNFTDVGRALRRYPK